MEITIRMVASDRADEAHTSTSDHSGNIENDSLNEQRWFFPLLSKCRVETMLNKLSTDSCDEISYFIVSNEPSSRDYRLSVRRSGQSISSADAIEHMVISYNKDDCSYGIDEGSRYNSVIDVVRRYVESHNDILKPLSGSLDDVINENNTPTEPPPSYSTVIRQPSPVYIEPLPAVQIPSSTPKGATLEHPFCHSTNNGFVKVTHSNVTHSNVTHGNERFHKCCNNQVCETITRGVTWILHIIYSIFFYASCCCCYWMCESDDWGGR